MYISTVGYALLYCIHNEGLSAVTSSPYPANFAWIPIIMYRHRLLQLADLVSIDRLR